MIENAIWELHHEAVELFYDIDPYGTWDAMEAGETLDDFADRTMPEIVGADSIREWAEDFRAAIDDFDLDPEEEYDKKFVERADSLYRRISALAEEGRAA